MSTRLNLRNQGLVPVEVQSAAQFRQYDIANGIRRWWKYFNVRTQIVVEDRNADEVFTHMRQVFGAQLAEFHPMMCIELRRDGHGLGDHTPWVEAAETIDKWHETFPGDYAVDIEQLWAKQMPTGMNVGLGEELTEYIRNIARGMPPGNMWAYPGPWSTDFFFGDDKGNMFRQMQFWLEFANAFSGRLFLSRSAYATPRAMSAYHAGQQVLIDAAMVAMGRTSDDPPLSKAVDVWRIFATKPGDETRDPAEWTMRECVKRVQDIMVHHPSSRFEIYVSADRFANAPAQLIQAIDGGYY